MFGLVREGSIELAKIIDGLLNGFEGCGGIDIEAALCKQIPGNDTLRYGAFVLGIESCELVTGNDVEVVGDDATVVGVIVERAGPLDAENLDHGVVNRSQLTGNVGQLGSYLAEGVGGMLGIDIEDDGDVIVATFEFLRQQFAEDVADVGESVTGILAPFGEEVAVDQHQCIRWQFLNTVKNPVPAFEFLFLCGWFKIVVHINQRSDVRIVATQTHHAIVLLESQCLSRSDVKDI